MEGRGGLRPGALRVGVDRARDGSWVLTVTGELDRFTVTRLAEAFVLATDGDHASVVLDMSGCSFVDSSGLSALVTADAGLRASGRRLEVVASPVLLRLLEATGLDAVLSIRTSLAPDGARGVEETHAEP